MEEEEVPNYIIGAVLRQDLRALEIWLDFGHDPHLRDDIGSVLMHYAWISHRGAWTAGILMMLERGFDANTILRIEPDSDPLYAPDNWKAIHFASYFNRVDLATALLDRGADVDDVIEFPADADDDSDDDEDRYMVTPLLIVMEKMHDYNLQSEALAEAQRNMIRFLLSRGASITAARRYGLAAEETAEELGLSEAVDIFSEFRLAGNWKRYINAPRVSLLVLRELCARDRASPPPTALAALFCAGSTSARPRTRRNPRAELPKALFWHILSYWRSDRDIDNAAPDADPGTS